MKFSIPGITDMFDFDDIFKNDIFSTDFGKISFTNLTEQSSDEVAAYKTIPTASLIPITLSLIACGCSDNKQAAAPAPEPISSYSAAMSSPTNTTSYKFIKMPNAFSGSTPFDGKGSSNKPIIFDINNDGYKDILFLWSSSAPVLGAKYSGVPTTAQLQLLVNQSGKGFVNQTDKYFPNSRIDGGADSFVIHDFNGDGILDVVLATSRDDGRNTDNPKDGATQLSALISNSLTGTFDNIKFGQSSWYFYVSKFDINGKTYISAAGAHGDSADPAQEVFTFENNKFVLAKGIFPEKSASDPWQPLSLGPNYIFYDDNGDHSADTLYNTIARTHLVVNGVETDNYTFGIDAYTYNISNNSWSHAGSYFPMNEKHFVKNIEFTGWNYNKQIQPVYEFGPSTYSVRDDALISSTIVKLSPSGHNLYAALFVSTVFQTDNIANVNSISEGDLTTKASISFFDVENGKLQKVEIPTKGFDSVELNGAHYLDTVDYNYDGYDDIVIYTWNHSNFPIVLLNDKNNSFYRIDEVVENKEYTSGSFFADFNNDGLRDIFSYVSDGNGDKKLPDMSQFDLYFGSTVTTVAENNDHVLGNLLATNNDDLFVANVYDMSQFNLYSDFSSFMFA